MDYNAGWFESQLMQMRDTLRGPNVSVQGIKLRHLCWRSMVLGRGVLTL